MAESLMRVTTNRVCRGFFMFILAGAGIARADILPDPTRPPASFASGGASVQSAETSGPVLQSVLVSPQRKIAIISGQTLRIGDRFGNARLVRITDTQVVLRSDNGLETLTLFPNVEKRPASNRPPVKPNK